MSKVLRLPCEMTSEVSKVLRLPRKMQRTFCKHRKSIAPATQNDVRHAMKDVGMSQSAAPATRNEATQRWKPPKVSPFAELTISTAIWSSRGRLRTVANGCFRLRNIWRTKLNPHTPRVKREPLLRIRENYACWDSQPNVISPCHPCNRPHIKTRYDAGTVSDVVLLPPLVVVFTPQFIVGQVMLLVLFLKTKPSIGCFMSSSINKQLCSQGPTEFVFQIWLYPLSFISNLNHVQKWHAGPMASYKFW